MKILLIDHGSELAGASLARPLGSGYEVVSALDGERAFDLLASARPDLMVLEVDLPGLTASRCAAVCAWTARAPIILFTARDG